MYHDFGTELGFICYIYFALIILGDNISPFMRVPKGPQAYNVTSYHTNNAT